MQYLRDELSLTESHEASLLSTYPLKVTFLKKTKLEPDPDKWQFWKMSSRALDILEKIEREGSNGSMSSFFIKNDSVLMESDRSYLESRRLRQYLINQETRYNLHGAFHSASVLISVICMMAILISSSMYMDKFRDFDIDRIEDDDCRRIDNDERQYLGSYLFVLFPFVCCSFLSSLLGILWAIIPKHILPTHDVLYSMYKGIVVIHSAFLFASFLNLSFAIRLGVGYQNLFSCSSDPHIIEGLTFAIIALSALCITGLLIITVIVLILIRCHVRRYLWEWVFFDELYRDKILAKIPRCKGKSSEAGPEETSTTGAATYPKDEQSCSATYKSPPPSGNRGQVSVDSPICGRHGEGAVTIDLSDIAQHGYI